MKVTFEEALEIIRNNITQAYIYACYNKSTKQNIGVLEEQTHRMVKVLEEQHKPPTWEKIVLVWEKLGYDNVNLSEHYKMLFLEGYGKNPLFVSLKDGIESNDDVYVDITVDMLNAINLTIRYLEAQKHHDL